MSIKIDSMEKFRAAEDILTDGPEAHGLSEDQWKQLQEAHAAISPAIDQAEAYWQTGTINHEAMRGQSDDVRQFSDILLQDTTAKMNVGADNKFKTAVAGMGEGVYQMIGNFGQMIGYDVMDEFAHKKSEEIKSFAHDSSVRRYEDAFGREMTDDERSFIAEETDNWLHNGALLEKGAVAASGGMAAMGLQRGFLSGAFVGAAEGLATGAITKEHAQKMGVLDAWTNPSALIGAAIGAPVGLLTGGAEAIRHVISKAVHRGMSRQDGLGYRLSKMAEEFGVTLTLGQATGNPQIIANEALASATHAQQLLASQGVDLASSLARKGDYVVGYPHAATSARVSGGFGTPPVRGAQGNLIPQEGQALAAGRPATLTRGEMINNPNLVGVGADTGNKVAKSFMQIEKLTREVKKARQKSWNKVGEKAIAVSGGRPILNTTHFQTEIDDVMRQMEITHGRQAVPDVRFQELIDEVRAAPASGGATAEQLDRWWRRINSMKEDGVGFYRSAGKDGLALPSTPTTEALISNLNIGFKRAMDASPDSTSLSLFKTQRDAWAQSDKYLKFLEDDILSTLGLPKSMRLFEKNGSKINADQFLEKIGRIPPENFRKMVQHFQKVRGGPAMLEDIRSSVFETMVRRGLQGAKNRPLMTGQLDVGEFADALANTSMQMKGLGLITPRQYQLSKQAHTLARAILNEPAVGSQVTKKITNTIENWAINLVSRNPGFLARLFAGMIQRGSSADQLFYTKEGIEVLKALHPQWYRWGKTAANRNAAIVVVADKLGMGAASREYNNIQSTAKKEQKTAQAVQKAEEQGASQQQVQQLQEELTAEQESELADLRLANEESMREWEEQKAIREALYQGSRPVQQFDDDMMKMIEDNPELARQLKSPDFGRAWPGE